MEEKKKKNTMHNKTKTDHHHHPQVDAAAGIGQTGTEAPVHETLSEISWSSSLNAEQLWWSPVGENTQKTKVYQPKESRQQE